MWVARYYHCDEPNTCLISNGFCSMGFALPGAIAAKLVAPDRNPRFGNPDFEQLAQAFGWAGFRCDDSADLQQTLEKALSAGRPALVTIPIDYRENALLSERLGEIEVGF